MDYLHLISGHDYPCVSNEEFDCFFENAAHGRSFMHYDTDKQHEQWRELISQRINRWHFNDWKTNMYIRRMMEELFNLFFPRNYKGELYAGWQWFSWHRSLAQWVVEYTEKNPDYLRRFRYTGCCDEVVFHTLLYPYIDELNIDKDNALRYIDWFPKRPADTLPLVLDEHDYQQICESKMLFCRKVYLDKSEKLLEMLDNRNKSRSLL